MQSSFEKAPLLNRMKAATVEGAYFCGCKKDWNPSKALRISEDLSASPTPGGEVVAYIMT